MANEAPLLDSSRLKEQDKVHASYPTGKLFGAHFDVLRRQ